MQNHANSGHSAIRPFSGEFRALISTASVDARDNTATHPNEDIPIYWLGYDSGQNEFTGKKIADDYTNFYDGGWDSNEPRDQNGNIRNTTTALWTGSNSDGTASNGCQAGRHTTRTAVPLNQGSELRTNMCSSSANSNPLYGLSPVITVQPNVVPSNWALAPTGVSDNDEFRLLFVSSGTRNAQSSDIGVYNTFVQNQAGGEADLQPFAGQFTALITTANVDARDNTGTHPNEDIPIYWVGGVKVADNYNDLYDGGWDSHVPRHQDGSSVSGVPEVWTGSRSNGTESSIGGTSLAAGQSNVAYGIPKTSGRELSHHFRQSSNTRHLYGLSPVFEVKDEPGAPNKPTMRTGFPRANQAHLEWSAPDYTGAYAVDEYPVRVRRCLSAVTAPCTSWTGWGFAVNTGATNHLLTVYGDDKGTPDTADDETLNLGPNTRYEVRVGARNRPTPGANYLQSDWSPTLEFITPHVFPDPLAVPTVGQVGATTARVSWTRLTHADAQFITSYRVSYQRSTGVDAGGNPTWPGDDVFVHVADAGATASARDVSGLPPGAHLRVRVGARATVDGTPYWSPWSGWSAGFQTQPEAVGLHRQVTLRWSQPLPSATGYTVEWIAGTATGTLEVAGGDTTEATVTGLVNGVIYNLRVVAKGVSWASRWTTATPAMWPPTADPTQVLPDWALTPTGLEVGDQFRLLFVSSGSRNAESADIGDYNTFVRNQANGGHADIRPLAGQFKALISTGAVDARDTRAPIPTPTFPSIGSAATRRPMTTPTSTTGAGTPTPVDTRTAAPSGRWVSGSGPAPKATAPSPTARRPTSWSLLASRTYPARRSTPRRTMTNRMTASSTASPRCSPWWGRPLRPGTCWRGLGTRSSGCRGGRRPTAGAPRSPSTTCATGRPPTTTVEPGRKWIACGARTRGAT